MTKIMEIAVLISSEIKVQHLLGFGVKLRELASELPRGFYKTFDNHRHKLVLVGKGIVA